MFEGEHASLNAIHRAVPSLCPRSFAEGLLEDSAQREGEGAFLVTEFLDMSGRISSSNNINNEKGSGMSLAAKLAKLHTTPAPIPDGYSKPVFGFPVTTCCGDTEQVNDFTESWADFYAHNRLLAILGKCEDRNGKDKALRSLVEKTVAETVPRLIGNGYLNHGKGVAPVVVHGDLWSGNQGRGRIGVEEAVEDVVFDPSACYAHSEYELGIMRMFGGFGELGEYHALCPKTEPVGEYGDRVRLYEYVDSLFSVVFHVDPKSVLEFIGNALTMLLLYILWKREKADTETHRLYHHLNHYA